MKFGTKGIGWLIFGLIVCMSSTESDDIAGSVSTIVLGLVFVGVYLMKQKFDPSGTAWFIVGGILGAFCVDCLISMLGGFVSSFSILKDDLSTLLISVIIMCGCMYMFYRSNKSDLEQVADEIGMDDEFSFPGQEEVFRERPAGQEVEQTEDSDVEWADMPESGGKDDQSIDEPLIELEVETEEEKEK